MITGPSSLSAGTVGVSYSAPFSASGGTGTGYSWSSSGSLGGLSFSSSGVLSGTPTTAGSSTPTFTVTDSGGNTKSVTLGLTINRPTATLTITGPASLPSGTVGVSYSATTFSATGGTGTGYSWSSSGSLGGLSFSAAGVLSGTPATASSYTPTFTVTDSGGHTASVTLGLTITNPTSTLTITGPGSLPSGTVGVPYSAITFSATGGTGTGYSWSSSGSLDGLGFSVAGVLSGTPATTGGYGPTFTVTDSGGHTASVTLGLTIGSPPTQPLTITGPSSLPTGTAGVSYPAVTFSATGGTGTGYTWSSTGALGGLSFSAAGVLSGSPATAGTTSPTFFVTDSGGNTKSVMLGLTINPAVQYLLTTAASPASGGSVSVTPSSSKGSYNSGTSVQLTALAAPNYTFSGWSGDLSGSANPQTLVMDSPHSVTAIFLAPSTLTITTSSVVPGLLNVVYPTSVFGVTNGKVPCTWQVSGGSLPPGMNLNGGGVLSGTPQSTGSYTFTAQVKDSSTPPLIQTASFTLVVTQPTTLLSVSSQQLNFSYSPGDPNLPAAQSVGVLSTPGATSVSVNAPTTSDGGTWLSASPSFTNSQTPGSILVAVSPGSLTPNTTYNGQVIISAPNATPSSVTVDVTLQVGASLTPLLSITPLNQTQSFALPQGAQSQGSVSVANAGGGTLNYSATAISDGTWLSLVSGASGSATPSTPATVAFAVNATGVAAGLHQGTITVTDGSGNIQLSYVDLLVNGSTPSMQLSQAGLTFDAVANVSVVPPPQYVSIYNLGSGTFSWSTQIQYPPSSTSGWLSVTLTSGATASGISSAATPGELQVSVNPAGLPVGQYSALVNVISTGVVNTPQTFSVQLNVVSAGAFGSTPQISSSGAIFAAPTGGTASAAQTLNLFNPAGTSLTYSTSVLTSSGGNWLSVTPPTGSLGSSGSATLTANASAASLSPGIYNGTVQVAFGQGTVETLSFAFVVLPSGATPALRQDATKAASSSCTPTKLAVVLIAPAGGIQFVAGQQPAETNVAAEISDNCYNPVTPSGSKTITNTLLVNGAPPSPPVTFTYDANNAVWTGTWTPGAKLASAQLQLLSSVSVSGGAGSYSGVSTLTTVGVLPSPPGTGNPQVTSSSVINGASFLITTPGQLAPGEYVSIFGSNLADTTQGGVIAFGQPLYQSLGTTSVSLSGQPVPLVSAVKLPAQLNGVVPQNLNSASGFSLSVQRDGINSAQAPIIIFPFQPGIYTQSQTGVGQGSIINYAASVTAGATVVAGPSGTGSQPVSRGGVIEIFATGLGAVVAQNGSAPPPADGQPAPSSGSPLFVTATTPTITFGSGSGAVTVPAAIFSGLAPGWVSLYQLNVTVPANAPTGNAVPITITMTDINNGNVYQSQKGVTIAIQ
jgi:large repetitive protein